MIQEFYFKKFIQITRNKKLAARITTTALLFIIVKKKKKTKKLTLSNNKGLKIQILMQPPSGIAGRNDKLKTEWSSIER